MSFFSTLGQKISGTAHRVGSKVMGAVHKGEKFVAKHGDTISKVAGAVGNVAGMAAAGIAATGVGAPLAGAVAGIAAGAKVVERVSQTATSAARAGLAAEDAVRAAKGGNFSRAIASGRTAIAQGKTTRGLGRTLK